MAEGRQRDEWNRSAQLCETIVNCQVSRRQDRVHAWQFNPFEIRERKTMKAKPATTITSAVQLAALFGVTEATVAPAPRVVVLDEGTPADVGTD